MGTESRKKEIQPKGPPSPSLGGIVHTRRKFDVDKRGGRDGIRAATIESKRGKTRIPTTKNNSPWGWGTKALPFRPWKSTNSIRAWPEIFLSGINVASITSMEEGAKS